MRQVSRRRFAATLAGAAAGLVLEKGVGAGLPVLSFLPPGATSAVPPAGPEAKPISAQRMGEEWREIETAAGAKESLLRLTASVSKLRARGALLAPLGRTAGSSVACQIGLHQSNPEVWGLQWDALVPDPKGHYVSFALGLAPAPVQMLVEELGVGAQPDPWMPGLLHLRLPGLSLVLDPIMVHQIPASAGADVARPQVIAVGLARWLELLQPQTLPDLARALALYRPGASWGQALELLKDPKKEWLLYREAAIDEIRRRTLASRLDVVRYLRAAGQKIPEEMAAARQPLAKASDFLDRLDVGILVSKSHYLAQAAGLVSPDVDTRCWTWSRLTSLSPACAAGSWEADLFGALGEDGHRFFLQAQGPS